MTEYAERPKYQYVVGFLFSPDRKHLALIEKQKPEWQKGLFNGIGGKREGEETFPEAMHREFLEETGVEIPPDEWDLTCRIQSERHRYICYFFCAFSEKVFDVRTVESEKVVCLEVTNLPHIPVVGNLRWLIPHALDPDRKHSLTLSD